MGILSAPLMSRKFLVLAAGFLVVAAAFIPSLEANEVITCMENTAIIDCNILGTISNTPTYIGQAFTTASSLYNFNHIAFTFVEADGLGEASVGQPFAIGIGYLLSQPYTGTPADLGASVPGYITSVLAHQGYFTFPFQVTIHPNTQYFFYDDTEFSDNMILGGVSDVPGAFGYFTSSAEYPILDRPEHQRRLRGTWLAFDVLACGS